MQGAPAWNICSSSPRNIGRPCRVVAHVVTSVSDDGDFGISFPHSSGPATPSSEQLAEQQGKHTTRDRPWLYLYTPVPPKNYVVLGPCHHTSRLFLSTVLVNGMFLLRTYATGYMDGWFKMAAIRVAPSGSRSRTLWRCGLMAGLISTLLGGGGAQVTTSSLSSLASLSTAATSTTNRLTASTTYTPTATWTPAATCSAGSSAVGGYGGVVYLDGYGTYWSVACGYDWDGTTFYDGAGYAYVSWRA